MGYEALREQTLARQKKMGLVPAETELPPVNPIGTTETRTGPDGKPFPAMDVTKPWDSLSDGEKELFCRMAEVYAGFLAHTDHYIGKLLDYLEWTGLRENTIVILVSDNGASGEGGPDGSVNENRLFNGMPDDLEPALKMLDELGGPKTYNHYANGWAMAFNTPFKMWKRYEFNGGTSDPCIISWPAGMKAKGELRTQYHHAIDLVPTVLDCLGVEAPQTIKGHVQSRFDGVSMRYSFDDATAEGARKTQFYSMLGSRGIWHEGWKAVTTHPDDRRMERLQRRRPGSSTTPTWTAPSSTTCQGGPGEAEGAAEPLVRRGRQERRLPARRPLAAGDHPDAAAAARAAAGPVHLLPRHRRRAGAAGGQRPQPLVRDRGARRYPGAGARGRAVRPRRALRRPCPLRQGQTGSTTSTASVGMFEQKVDATEDLPTGEDLILSASFDKDGEDPPARGDRHALALPRREEGRRGRASRPSPAVLSLAGEGLCVGRDSGEAVTDDYPGTSPHSFTGGTIKRVAVDVSGEPYLDLERQAQAMLARE